MWPQFDRVMRAALLSAALRRAKERALKYSNPVENLMDRESIGSGDG